MSMFKKLGLGPKKQQNLPFKGEKLKKEEEAYSFKKNPYIRWMIFGVFILISILSLPRSEVRTTTTYTVGQPWRADDLTAPFTFAINKTRVEIEAERQNIQEQIPPVFVVDNNAELSIQSEIDSIYLSTQNLLDRYHLWQVSLSSQSPTTLEDSIAFQNELQNHDIGLTEPALNALMKSYHEVAGDRMDLTPREVFDNSNFIGNRVRNTLTAILSSLLNQGIIDVNKSMVSYDVFTLLNTSESTEQPTNIARVRDLREANEYSLVQLNARLNPEETRLAIEIYNKVMKANYVNNPFRQQQRLPAQGRLDGRQGDRLSTHVLFPSQQRRRK